TSYDGTDASQPVVIARADGSTLRRIDYLGSAVVGAGNSEIAGFIEDEWAAGSRLTVHGGARYGYEQIAGQQTIAPPIDAALRPFEDGRTVIKAGIGRFFDKLPLTAADFERQQARRVTEFDAAGDIVSASLVANRIAADGLSMPESTAWNAEVDQLLAANLQA